MDITELSYNDLEKQAMTLLNDDDKVRKFLMETTRIMWALSKCDAINKSENKVFKRNYWRFVCFYNLTATTNRNTAKKVYARFVGGYCEGLEPETVEIMGLLFDSLAISISKGESKATQQNILDDAINYLYKY